MNKIFLVVMLSGFLIVVGMLAITPERALAMDMPSDLSQVAAGVIAGKYVSIKVEVVTAGDAPVAITPALISRYADYSCSYNLQKEDRKFLDSLYGTKVTDINGSWTGNVRWGVVFLDNKSQEAFSIYMDRAYIGDQHVHAILDGVRVDLSLPFLEWVKSKFSKYSC